LWTPVAGRFPTIEANYVYYFQVCDLAEESYIYKFNIETFDDDEKPELVSAAMGSNDMVWRTNSPRPFTIIHLLCNYTMDTRLRLNACNYVDW